jgi:hypothetical protein
MNHPTRWTSLESGEDGAGQAGALLRAARRPPPPGPAAIARVRKVVLAAPPRRQFPWLKLVLVAASLLVSWEAGVAVVAQGRPLLQRLRARLASPTSAPALPPVAGALAVTAPLPPLRAPPLAPPPIVVAVPPRARASNAPLIPAPLTGVETPPAPAVAPPKSELVLESEALTVVFAALRDANGQAALEQLTRYRRNHPAGALSGQAETAELEARLLLHDDARASALLDRFEAHGFVGVADADRLRALHGELLLRQGSPAKALAVFDRLASTTGEARERARYGRAAALVALGRAAEGRVALQGYLSEYPAGRFAAEVRRALGSP